jgi:hypothetical protein
MRRSRKEITPRSRGGDAVGAVGRDDQVNAPIIPFRVRGTPDRRTPHLRHPRPADKTTGDLDAPAGAGPPMARIIPHPRAKVAGRVRSILVPRWSGFPTRPLTITVKAGDRLVVVFFGRRPE